MSNEKISVIVKKVITVQADLADKAQARDYARTLAKSGATVDFKNEIDADNVLWVSLLVNGEVETTVRGWKYGNVVVEFVGLVAEMKAKPEGAASGGTGSGLQRGNVSAEDRTKMHEMADQGTPAEEIAKAFNRSLDAVNKVLATALPTPAGATA